jgi:integrase
MKSNKVNKKTLTPREHKKKWWRKNKKKQNEKRRTKWKLIKDEKNRERREKYHQLDLTTINRQRVEKYWGGSSLVPTKKKSSHDEATTKRQLKKQSTRLRIKRPPKIPPNQKKIKEVWDYVVVRSRKSKWRNQYLCLFLLCWEAGLRVTEAINFNYNLKHPEHPNWYLVRGKGRKDRWVCVHPETIAEIKKKNWQPRQGNRTMFHAWLQQIKKEMNLSMDTQLEPHTLRRCFATHNKLNNMPLPILQKNLGHSNIVTTSIYVKDAEMADLVKHEPIRWSGRKVV